MAGTTANPARHTQAEMGVQTSPNPQPQGGQLGERVWRLLLSEDPIRIIGEIPVEDREKLIDEVNQAYETVNVDDRRFLISFGNFCSFIKRLPPSALLSTGLVKCGSFSIAPGGLADLWRGEYLGLPVAIKAFRVYPARNLEEAKRILWRLVPMWKKFFHKHIAVFRGVTTDHFQLALVYDWGESGNIVEYVESHPGVSRLTLLLEVARGLQYLHSLDVPHGNLKGSNVLVDKSGHALLTEYALAAVNTNSNLTMSSPTVRNWRWLAPEIIDPPASNTTEVVVESKPADIFALGMLAAEVFAGKPPFEEYNDTRAAHLISDGERPERPENAELTPEVWQLFQRCWDQDPMQRPVIEEVVKTCEGLLGITDEPRPTPPPTGTARRPQGPNTGTTKKWWKKWLCAWG